MNAVEEDLALVRHDQPVEQPQQGRLPASARTDEAHELTWRNVEAHAIEGVHRAVLEEPADALHPEMPGLRPEGCVRAHAVTSGFACGNRPCGRDVQ